MKYLIGVSEIIIWQIKKGDIMKSIPTGKWTISQDEEYWNNDEELSSKEDAIEFGKSFYEGEGFFVGQIVKLEFLPSDVSLSDNAMESLSEQLYEEVGEVAENWENEVSKEAYNDLETIISEAVMKWIEKYSLQPSTFTLSCVDWVGKDDEHN